MKKAVRTIKAPKEFKIDILDYDKFLTVQFYESQWRHYTDTERFQCIQYLDKVKKILESLGARVALDPILDVKYKDKYK
jgi:hypothetical protein